MELEKLSIHLKISVFAVHINQQKIQKNVESISPQSEKLSRNKKNYPKGQYSIQCRLVENSTKQVIDWWVDYEELHGDAINYFSYLSDAHKSFDYDVDYTGANV